MSRVSRVLHPSLVLDGRVIGTWRRVLGRTAVALEVDLFEEPTRRAHGAIALAARRYGAFLGIEAEIASTAVCGRTLTKTRRPSSA